MKYQTKCFKVSDRRKTNPLYNGNIAQTFWKTSTDNIQRSYTYTYDQLNRLRTADFYKSGTVPYTGSNGEYIAYDLNGNIVNLIRTTADLSNNAIDMDNLTYTYQNGNNNSNRLMRVEDSTSVFDTNGFLNGNSGTDDYAYDANGNMTRDRNKDITEITYNYMNLPEHIYFGNGNGIEYFYNAAGQKVKKTVYDTTNNTVKEVDYLDGFQYTGGVLNFFPHSEGYVSATESGVLTNPILYNYVYNYTDHLGNIRLSYTKDPVSGDLEIMEENNYYPFGLKHSVYSDPKQKYELVENEGESMARPTYVYQTDYQYKYNGKEYQDELNLNLYDYGARNYDPALGRFFSMDKYSDSYYNMTPYQYTANNPVKLIDVNGEYIWIYENGNKYKYENGQLYSQNKETKEYDQEYTAEEGSYVAQMQGYLNQIGCDDCKDGKALLDFFGNEDYNVTIRENKVTNKKYKEKNAFNPAGNTIITFFNQSGQIPTTDGFEAINKNFFTTLGHELGHAQSHFLYGGVRDELWYTQYGPDGDPQEAKKDEVYATYIENKLRKENNLPLRTHYSTESSFKVNENSKVLHKVKGNWIMTPDARVILNAIQSPSNRK